MISSGGWPTCSCVIPFQVTAAQLEPAGQPSDGAFPGIVAEAIMTGGGRRLSYTL